jgi:hypothetical protein
VTFLLFDTDWWQHLVVGRYIWDHHAVPTTQLWSWPTYGAPDINASWGFRVLIWPLWSAMGITGLFVWRWLAVLLSFGFAVAAARRMGARGVAPLVLAVIAALATRGRSQVRPESLAVLLVALEILVLESRRAGRRVPALAVVPVLWMLVNAHITYHIGFFVLGAYALDESFAKRRVSPLWLAIPVGLAAGLLNPWGWRALWEPFRYFLFERNEAIFTTIGELRPVVWSANWRNGLPLLVAGWPLLALARLITTARSRRASGAPGRSIDVAELILCPVLVGLTLSGVRFVGMLGVVAVPFMARDLGEWMRVWRAGRAPLPLSARAAAASAAMIAAFALEMMASPFIFGIGFEERSVPIAACDAIAARNLRGRFFNPFHYGGYLLWRFWPDPGRLPFLDVHARGTHALWRLFLDGERSPEAWKRFTEAERFDVALLARPALPGDHLADFMDADTSWALVFLDDAAALYVKKTGATAGEAAKHAYRLVPAGNVRAAMLGDAAARDPVLRARVRAELERQLRESPYNALAHRLLASLALADGNLAEARDHLRIVVRELPDEVELKRTLAEIERRIGAPPGGGP